MNPSDNDPSSRLSFASTLLGIATLFIVLGVGLLLSGGTWLAHIGRILLLFGVLAFLRSLVWLLMRSDR